MMQIRKRATAILLACMLVLTTLAPVAVQAQSEPTQAAAEDAQAVRPDTDEMLSEESERKGTTPAGNEQEDTLEVGSEPTPEAVGASPSLAPDNLVVIAKDKDGNCYGIPQYNKENEDILGTKIFFKISAEDYEKAHTESMVHMKRKDGLAFEIPRSTIPGVSGDRAGAIFMELEFRHFPAFQYFVSESNMTYPTSTLRVKDVVWAITLYKDAPLEKVPGFAGSTLGSEPFVIDYNCEIDGRGHRLYRKGSTEDNQSVVLMGTAVPDINVTFKNIVIDGSEEGQPKYRGLDLVQSDGGPKITLAGNVTIENCKTDTKAYGGSAISLKQNTGLIIKGEKNIIRNCISERSPYSTIYLEDPLNIQIDGATFLNNKAPNGGAITSLDKDAEIEISNTTFENNEVTSVGGAIYTASKTTLKKCTFIANKTRDQGGAIYTTGTTTVQDSTFTSNEAAYQGGAIYQSKGTIDITGSSFDKNVAKQGGGAIYAKKGSGGTKSIKNKFQSNEAEWGGAIMTYAPLTINRGSFHKNVATSHGGAIYVYAMNRQGGQFTGVNDTVKINISDNTKFESNMAKVGEGGAIYTRPYQYNDPIDKEKINPIEEQKPYENLEIAGDTIFTGNTASRSYAPPQNYHEFTNLGFKQNSCADKAHINARYAESILNNFDVNYKNDNKLITYNANGGRFPDGSTIKTKEYPKGERITILDAPKRGGYDFLYWKGSEHHPGDKYTVEDNHTFTAQWEKKPPKPPAPPIIEKIIVDPNGGTFSDGATGRKFFEVAVGKIFHLPSAPTREGYKFIAWKGTDAEYQPDYSYVVKPGGETFVAVWEGEEEPKPAPMPKPRPYVPVPRVSLPVIPTIPKAGAGK